jgi:uncharacterized protein (TIGR02246 family)
MRRIVVGLAALAFLLPAGSAGAAGLSEEDMAAIQAVTEAWESACNANDAHALAALYSEDAMLAPPNEPLMQGRQRIEAFFAASPKFSDVKLENVEVRGSGDLAYVAGIYMLKVHIPGLGPIEDTGKYLDVRRKQEDGSWLIVADAYNTSIPLPGDDSE